MKRSRLIRSGCQANFNYDNPVQQSEKEKILGEITMIILDRSRQEAININDEEIREEYPQGFINHMINFTGKDNQLFSALPHETDEITYLIKMPASLPLEEKEDEPNDPVDSLPLVISLENIDEEKFLVQEEEEEESD